MVKPFQFARVPRIIFKPGSVGSLPDLIKPYGSRIALITGRNSFLRSTQGQNLVTQLSKSKIEYNLISIQGEPSPEDIDSAVQLLKSEDIELVVGIGGGSVIDAGKAISAMLSRSESIVRFLEGVGDLEHPGTKVPFFAIPTTSGTGSEATKNAVISKVGTDGFKKSLRHDNFVPDLALVDPDLTVNCPPDITAASGMDCFTQLAEAYLSDKSSEYTDALAMEGLKAIERSLTRCCSDGQDAEARAGMSFAALTSGICLANAGLGVVHGFASSVGGMYNIPHGLVCGTLMAKTNEINVRELRKMPASMRALNKYSLLGQLFLDEKGKSDDYYIDGFISYLHKLTAALGLPGLKKYCISDDHISAICAITENKNNPVKLTIDDLHEILSSRCI
ncbi:MAG: iron-containing alcohol dehydrogenase [Bacteroidales bacterium]|nr:iron-containing alcohol dehydrogenase [Bacteroidales bacterium]